MKRWNRDERKHYSAFTLAEVLITMAVIGVVAAVALPALLLNIQENLFLLEQQMLSTLLSTNIIRQILMHRLSSLQVISLVLRMDISGLMKAVMMLMLISSFHSKTMFLRKVQHIVLTKINLLIFLTKESQPGQSLIKNSSSWLTLMIEQLKN